MGLERLIMTLKNIEMQALKKGPNRKISARVPDDTIRQMKPSMRV